MVAPALPRPINPRGFARENEKACAHGGAEQRQGGRLRHLCEQRPGSIRGRVLQSYARLGGGTAARVRLQEVPAAQALLRPLRRRSAVQAPARRAGESALSKRAEGARLEDGMRMPLALAEAEALHAECRKLRAHAGDGAGVDAGPADLAGQTPVLDFRTAVTDHPRA